MRARVCVWAAMICTRDPNASVNATVIVARLQPRGWIKCPSFSLSLSLSQSLYFSLFSWHRPFVTRNPGAILSLLYVDFFSLERLLRMAKFTHFADSSTKIWFKVFQATGAWEEELMKLTKVYPWISANKNQSLTVNLSYCNRFLSNLFQRNRAIDEDNQR